MPKRILLADDSITIQKVVELTFSDGDYEVTAVNNGAKAVQKLTEMRPDIILSDIIMPEKNGYEVCEYVKSHPEYRNIPVVLLTGTFEPFDPDRAEKAGCDAVVTKPFESQSLIHKVEELIAHAQSAPAAAPAPEPEAASPWADDAPAEEAPAAPATESPFSSGGFASAVDPFMQNSDVFGGSAPTAAPTTEMAFDAPAESPFGAPPDVEEFGGETRAFPRMSFEEMQRMVDVPATPPPPPPPAAPEPSPWDEQPETAAFGGGETRAFPPMTFDDVPPAMPSMPEPQADSPFGASPDAEEFSGETRAFPRMSFEEMQQMAGLSSAPSAPSEPEFAPEPPAASEPSPWDEQPEAFGGETRAFPRMSFDEMQRMAGLGSEASAPPEPAPWEPPAFDSAAMPEDMPFTSEPSAPAEESSYAEMSSPQEVPPPQDEPTWAPQEAAQAQAEPEEPPVSIVPAPAFAQETPAIPIARNGDLSDEQVDRIARRVVEMMSDQVVRNIAWEVIPDLAEMVVKERIRQLESEA